MGKFSWQDGVAFVAGIVALLAPGLWAHNVGQQPLMILGALLALAGLYALLSATGPSAWTATAFAVLIFVSPWAFGFDNDNTAAWTAWITGGVAAVVGVWSATQARSSSTA